MRCCHFLEYIHFTAVLLKIHSVCVKRGRICALTHMPVAPQLQSDSLKICFDGVDMSGRRPD